MLVLGVPLSPVSSMYLQELSTSMCNVQVRFFVGVQLDISAPPTADAHAQHLELAAGHNVAPSREPADAAPPCVSV